jgi:enterobactin synthetase component D / holo-[acyl-carrier protein] synthase
MLNKYPAVDCIPRELEEAAELVAQSIRAMVPAAAVVVESVRDLTSQLYPSEDAAVSGSVAKRRIEFSTGRHCARRALAMLGHSPQPIRMGPDGAPVWPADVAASLSHSGGLCVVVAAPRRLVAALGCDLESIERVSTTFLPQIAKSDEIARNRKRVPDAWLPACLFSIREAVFKAYSPSTGGGLTFDDVEIDLDGRERTFRATLTNPRRPPLLGSRVIGGRFDVVGRFVATVARCSA